jgi:DNA-directed RNA polymerase beta' subunit
VETVEDAGERQVFDFEVEGTKVFAVNYGLVIWDTMSYTVPVTQAAVQEVINKMMPERNLVSVASGKPVFSPTQEYTMGGYFMSKTPAKEKVRTFRTWADAKKAYMSGEIHSDTPIKVGA